MVKMVSGDYNGDGRTDIALTGVLGWNTLPVAFSNGNGHYSVSNSHGAGCRNPGPAALCGLIPDDGQRRVLHRLVRALHLQPATADYFTNSWRML
jgi:hypothetical protein